MTKSFKFEIFDSRSSLQSAAAEQIEHGLQSALELRDRATFMCSGGSTPGPVYEMLSAADLDWSSVLVGLADERWVDTDHPGSNAALLRRTLLQNQAARATFIPMKTSARSPFDAVDEVSERYSAALSCDIMLLGMGPDAHTLSWFPNARGLDQALGREQSRAVAAIEAQKSAVTGDNLMRMTLTLPCVSNARSILLLITGAEKRRVFESADDMAPISIMRDAAADRLTVFYAD